MEFGNQSKSYLSILTRLGLNSFKTIGYQKLTVDGTVGGLSLTIPTGAKYARLSFESSIASTTVAARYKTVGPISPVTATDGMQIRDGLVFDLIDNQNLVNFRVIQATAGTHTLHIEYGK